MTQIDLQLVTFNFTTLYIFISQLLNKMTPTQDCPITNPPQRKVSCQSMKTFFDTIIPKGSVGIRRRDPLKFSKIWVLTPCSDDRDRTWMNLLDFLARRIPTPQEHSGATRRSCPDAPVSTGPPPQIIRFWNNKITNYNMALRLSPYWTHIFSLLFRTGSSICSTGFYESITLSHF